MNALRAARRFIALGRPAVLGVAFALGGCATGGIVMHRMPAETPAADNAAAIKRVQAAIAAATQVKQAARAPDAPPRLTSADAPSMRTYDPWERLNRFSYRFNARFDESVFLPVANGYGRLPSPLRSGVHHFFSNLSEVDSVINYTLQGRLGRGVRSLGRFVINSTVGIGGLLDVATPLHVLAEPTGFGTTLAAWGLHPGPYLVIPILGPSTAREAGGMLADYGIGYGINLADLYRGDQSWALGLVNAVDTRANVNFRYYSSGSPFDYDNLRFLYVRKLLLQDATLHKLKVPAARAVPAGKAPAGQ